MEKNVLSENVTDYSQIFTKAGPQEQVLPGFSGTSTLSCQASQFSSLRVQNGSLKNMGLGKFWPDLKFRSVFYGSHEVSFSGDLASWSIDLRLES